MNITKLNELKAQRVGLVDSLRAVAAKADAERRNMTGEELAEFGRIDTDVRELDGNISAAERVLKLDSAKLGAEASRDEAEARSEKTGVGSDEYRAAFLAHLTRPMFLNADEARALSVGTDSAGGYTAPPGFRAQLIEYAREMGVMLTLADVFETTEGNDVEIPTLTGHGASGWGTEAGTYTGTDPAFGHVVLGAYKAWHIAKVSEELVQDSALDIEGLLTRKIGEALGVLANTAYVAGDGSGKPTGITASPTVGKLAADDVTFTADEVIDLIHSVKTPYRRNGKFLVNDLTVAFMRKLKDGDGNYLWSESAQAGVPSSFLGYSVETDPDMPTIAADKSVVLFGDFARGYSIRNVQRVGLQRLNELFAGTGQIGYRAFIRTDGKPTDPNAVKALDTAAS